MTRQSAQGSWGFSAPLKVGLGAAAVGLILATVGILRGQVPLNPISILLALLISGGTWGLVAWAVATAAADVESDVAAAEAEQEQGHPPAAEGT